MFNLHKDLMKEAKEIQQLGVEIKGMQKLVEHSYEKMKVYFDLIPALIFSKDRDNNIVYINSYGAKMHSVEKEDMLGSNWRSTLTSDEARKYFDNDCEIFALKQPKYNILERTVFDRNRWLLTNKVPIFDAKGEVKEILGISIEVTKLMEDCGNA